MNKEEFQQMLDNHDWFYDWTDDGRVWRVGYARHQEILVIAKSSPEFAKLYDDAWFKHFCLPHFDTSRDKAPMVSYYV